MFRLKPAITERRLNSFYSADDVDQTKYVAMKVLIVEDEALVAMNLQAVLEDHGYQVVEIADDEASAVLAGTHFRPDLALVDIRLAGGDSGVEVARKLNALGIAVVFATGNCPGLKGESLALGCLHKPLSDEQLIAGMQVAEALRQASQNPPPPPPGMHLFN